MESMHEKRFEGDISRLRSPERVERLEVERVINLCLEKGPFISLLDVGTGTGLFAEAFAKRGLKVSGVDINPEMMAAAQMFVPDGDFREGTAETLPFPDGSFDFVFMGVVLHETDDVSKALQETRRVTRQQACILEWPYREQSFGPPLTDRLNPEDLVGLFQKVGFRKWKTTELSNTVLYCLEV
jgi:ubiquinone/menaquinone biosynthesis C-methylase UbiE